MSDVDPISQVLTCIDAGDHAAAERLFPLVYQELRQRAAAILAGHRSGNTLQPTAVVHEAYLKIAAGAARQWQSRRHFFNAAAEAMRQILVDHARSKAAQKRGGSAKRVDLDQIDLDQADLATPAAGMDWESLDRALQQLKTEDPR